MTAFKFGIQPCGIGVDEEANIMIIVGYTDILPGVEPFGSVSDE